MLQRQVPRRMLHRHVARVRVMWYPGVARGAAAGVALARGGDGTGARRGWHWPAVGMALARGGDGTGPRQGWHWPAAGMALARGEVG
jgi:hypothetical protein